MEETASARIASDRSGGAWLTENGSDAPLISEFIKAEASASAIFGATPRPIDFFIQNAPGNAPPSIRKFCPTM